ncbi:MAG: ABC transporter ATP-binding protein [Candidatus Eremiobacteraeota bacterium]|nr:ABC transporter ATP-binding protein [Candidatus Eremiobacteraeota bacterium]MBC5803227.1 ABC transporter ATP-binding protein [Candidatus Eremiobacteraeota bacterium]MBC5823007.1 ABC transporter ATP-binding protein [Candidatus Eremiobacteraeota bacterium]
MALTDLTLTVRRGEIFGFLGPNGAGKTTAVKLLLGLTRPTSGAGEVLSAPLGDRAVRRRIGYLPELFRYQEWLDAREVLGFHARLLGLATTQRRDESERVLSIVGLTARAHDRVGTYSKGMQQRLGLAVALLGSPTLVFLDEPTSALDPLGRHDVRVLIEGLRAAGTTVFLNSHLLTEVERVCDRIAVVDRGKVVAAGSLNELLGSASLVRLQLGGIGPAARDVLARIGARSERAAAANGTPVWYSVPTESADAIPAIVRQIVAAGAAVFAVEPQRATLEERFLEILTEECAVAGNHVADPA